MKTIALGMTDNKPETQSLQLTLAAMYLEEKMNEGLSIRNTKFRHCDI